MKSSAFVGSLVLAAACAVSAIACAQSAAPAVSNYGERNANAPKELDTFAFLVGKWEGSAMVKLPDGTSTDVAFTWIGRYVLDGMAIADDIHSFAPDGSPVLGVTLRQFDASKKTWIVEFLNISNSFVRKQVNADSGSVTVDGNTVVVISEAPDTWSRESYRVDSPDRFAYSLELSNDGGRTWNKQPFDLTLSRKE